MLAVCVEDIKSDIRINRFDRVLAIDHTEIMSKQVVIESSALDSIKSTLSARSSGHAYVASLLVAGVQFVTDEHAETLADLALEVNGISVES
jgi:hypothetical protein